jgi:hypothetical protein
MHLGQSVCHRYQQGRRRLVLPMANHFQSYLLQILTIYMLLTSCLGQLCIFTATYVSLQSIVCVAIGGNIGLISVLSLILSIRARCSFRILV